MTTPDTVHQAEERLQVLLKAVVVGAAFVSIGALAPPYEPEALCLLEKVRAALRLEARNSSHRLGVGGLPKARRPPPFYHDTSGHMSWMTVSIWGQA